MWLIVGITVLVLASAIAIKIVIEINPYDSSEYIWMPTQIDRTGHVTNVVFVLHGFMGSRKQIVDLCQGISKTNPDAMVVALKYVHTWSQHYESLDKKLDRIRSAHKQILSTLASWDRQSIVGVSLGGLLARLLVDSATDSWTSLVTIGSPHLGVRNRQGFMWYWLIHLFPNAQPLFNELELISNTLRADQKPFVHNTCAHRLLISGVPDRRVPFYSSDISHAKRRHHSHDVTRISTESIEYHLVCIINARTQYERYIHNHSSDWNWSIRDYHSRLHCVPVVIDKVALFIQTSS